MRCLPAILILGLAVDAAAQDTRLFVYVTDYQNQLLPGARIEVHLENTDQAVAKVTAGAQGTASISVKPFRSLLGYRIVPRARVLRTDGRVSGSGRQRGLVETQQGRVPSAAR